MIRRSAPASPGRPVDLRQLFELLAQRHRALGREWRLCTLPMAVDDDLLPANQRLEDAMVEVALAMARIESGRYGRCVDCDRRIDFQRLLAHPAATRCWPCQQSAEQAGTDPPRH